MMDDIKNLNNEFSFIERLTQYYSDFLSTDFKKGSLPKRRFQTRDKKSRKSGIVLEKFPSFIPVLTKKFSKNFSLIDKIKIRPKTYVSQLPAVVLAAIEGEIKNLNFDELNKRNNNTVSKYCNTIRTKKEIDLEDENQKLVRNLQVNLGIVICAELINKLQPVFEKSASNVIDALVTVEDDLTELIVSPIEDTLPSVVYQIISENNEKPLLELLEETFNKDIITSQLDDYFKTFSSGDLASEIRELSIVEQLDDNLEFYLYFGNLRHKNNEFPIFYMPFKIDFEGAEATLEFEPRLLINKKAIDYIARIIQERTKTQGASPVDSRIIYINPEDIILKKLDDLIEPILRALQFDGSLSFTDWKKSKLKTSEDIVLTNTFQMALFDKSDESMLTDYEELLQQLGESGGDLLNFINNLVDSFLTENPTSIKNEIYDEWDEISIPDRLVFDTPIPLAEEQRQILSSLNNTNSRFITVEGPPGTGKSHTISAIAFGAILKKQSILILSDKKEALDVVENKLNDTLAKVRPSDDFINPILRLGRVGTNFKKIITNKSIENLRIQHREILKSKQSIESRYQTEISNLKESIKKQSIRGKEIKISEIFQFEQSWNDFIEDWKDEFTDFKKILESNEEDNTDEVNAINNLVSIREKCLKIRKNSPELFELAQKFGDEAISIANSLEFLKLVFETANNTGIFEIAPLIDDSKLDALNEKIREVKSSKGSIFGYLFSGSKLNLIKSSIYELIGFKIINTNGDKIIEEINQVLNKATDFYSLITSTFDNTENLIPIGLKIIKNSPELLDENQFIDDLKALHQTIQDDELPFIDDEDEEPISEILTFEESPVGRFYENFVSLREEKKSLEGKLNFPEYNFLTRKKAIENYNSLKLATEIDNRVINFADNYKNDARTLAQIISQRKKFPKDKFEILKDAFPCIICNLRDYAEYIPLEKELFDIIIIDEASQVSISQAFPAILRAKKLIVLGDRKQFGNVKTSNASKEQNNAYFSKVKEALFNERDVTSDLEIRLDKLNITNSILDFMENLSNFDIMLKKHFRGYPEMISFSSKYFYGNALQAMKIRGKPIDQILEFVKIEHNGDFDLYKNTNEQEVDEIIKLVIKQLDDRDFRTVAVITPFTEQQTLISKKFSEHERYEEILKTLKFRSFTFDSCQGEERDIIYYSFVATPEKDKLWSVLPKSMNEQDEEELDKSKKLQRMNVAFSRGKEKLVFIHSKDFREFSAGKEVLNHFYSELTKSKEAPSEDDVDQSSEAEKKVINWIKQSPVYQIYKPEIQTQYQIGKYIASFDKNYNHPLYRVDFLLRFNIDEKTRDIIIEYDGFEYHFNNLDEVDAGNWKYFLTDKDVEREHILESYGYKTIRLNKFNLGDNPIQSISDFIENILSEYEEKDDSLINQVLDDTSKAHEGFLSGTYKHCKKCNQNKSYKEFASPNTTSGFGRFCNTCVKPSTKKRRKKKLNIQSGHKKCPNCKKIFPDKEFLDNSTASGKRRLCGACKRISDRKRKESAERYFRAIGKWR